MIPGFRHMGRTVVHATLSLAILAGPGEAGEAGEAPDGVTGGTAARPESSPRPGSLPPSGPAIPAPGAGDSYWGPFPAPSPSNTARREDGRTPAWEHFVNAPYWVLGIPIRALTGGVEVTAEFLDESPSVGWLRRLLRPRAGAVRVRLGGSLGTSDGLGGSAKFLVPDFLRQGNPLSVGGAISTQGKRKVTLGVIYHQSDVVTVEVGAGYRAKSNTRFFGVGPESHEDRESFFLQETSWVGLTLDRRIGSAFRWRVTAMYSGAGALGSTRSDRPHLSTEFSGELRSGELPGYRDRSDGISVGLELRHDDTEEVARPVSGGLRRVKVTLFQGKGNSLAEFLTYRGELQQFVPLWFSGRALALRGLVSYIDDTGDGPVPFQRLLTNDDPDLFRGYKDFRFRDKGILALSVEYRWPVWALDHIDGPGLDAYAFVDYGQVFPEFDDIETDRMTTSYGGGLRLVSHGRYFGRVEFGWSEEDFVFRIRTDQIFQYARGGLFRGRNPVPER